MAQPIITPEIYPMKHTNPTFVLAFAIAGVLGTAPMSILAKNIESGDSKAISIGNVDIGQSDSDKIFGDSKPVITDDSKAGLQVLVTFAKPVDKTFVVRNGTPYNQNIRNVAMAEGITNDQRIAGTHVFAVEDALAACGLHMSAEQYALVRGLTVANTNGTLPNEVELLTAVYKDLKPRLDKGELQFKVSGDNITELS